MNVGGLVADTDQETRSLFKVQHLSSLLDKFLLILKMDIQETFRK